MKFFGKEVIIGMKRSEEEIAIRCRPILGQPDVIDLVGKSSSPTAAYDLVISIGKDDETAKAARWLAVLRRDYPVAYQRLVNSKK